MGKRSAWCNCEETKDEFGGCVPNETGKKCIACGKRINKKTIHKLKMHEQNVEKIFGKPEIKICERTDCLFFGNNRFLDKCLECREHICWRCFQCSGEDCRVYHLLFNHYEI